MPHEAALVRALVALAFGGSLEGRRLRRATHDAQFSFAVAAFLPDVEIVHPS